LASAVGNEVRKAAGGVAAEQRALRAAQHLDTINVEQGKRESRHLADVDVVDVNGGRTFLVIGKVVLRHTANRQTERRRSVRLGQYHRGHGLGNVRGRGGADRGQIVAGDRRQRDADVLRVLLAFLSGHHDFFEGPGGGCRLGMDRYAGGGQNDGNGIPLKILSSSYGHVSAGLIRSSFVAKSHAPGAFPFCRVQNRR
jgi:hypothetical protein